MAKILFLTVGGSRDPLITSINTLKPDFIVFVCSEDTGGRQGSYTEVPAILAKTGEYPHEIIKVNPDDPENCISKIMNEVERIKKENPNAEVFADYTGGTKTMSASLFWVATHLNFNICLTTGIRRDLVMVREGETTQRIHLSFPYYKELLSLLDSLLQNYHYTSAGESLRSALVTYSFSPEMREDLQRIKEVVEAFRLWDAYDSLRAFKKLQPYRKQLWDDYLCFWDKVIADRMKLEEDFYREVKEERISISYEHAGTQYAIVQDLLLNAERCEARGRYDDATARLYRATEALAQMRLLFEYKIKAWDVDVERVPAEWRGKYEGKRREGKVKIGLVEDYELLWELDDPLGRLFNERKVELRSALERRNRSIFAHGFKSIGKEEYEWEIKGRIEGFVKECLREILGGRYEEVKQLPKSIEEIEVLFRDLA
ncbi:MAG: TIGR02710 family CRISPR-associated CARF protein [bacterium]